MSTESLPQMPKPRYCAADHGYTAEQMRDYALAARKLALEEVRSEINKQIDEMSCMERHRYLDGARGEAIVIELWLKEIMEQDA